MNPELFHFSRPFWLWGLLAIPVMLAICRLLRRDGPRNRALEQFADKHLLPHLIKNSADTSAAWKLPLLIWALAWACGIMAMAGPQWRYTDTEVFKANRDVVIILDLSSTMNAADTKPSRLARAREEIDDFLDMNRGLTIGLVAYANTPHMVAPLTDDVRTIKNLLPSIDTSLITIDGDRLKPALEMAARMLEAEPGHDKSILVVSDGDFREDDIADLANVAKGAEIDTIGVGTKEGAPLQGADGNWSKNANGTMLIDRLHADKLQRLSLATGGIYVDAVYDNSDTRTLLNHIRTIRGHDTKSGGKTIRTWDEGFYVPALLMGVLMLRWFRRSATFPVILLFLFLALPKGANAAEISDWFRNPAQQGEAAFAAGHYDEAGKKFDDPYQQGVAAYKAGQYDKAAALFKAAEAQHETAATYNLGNAQLMHNQPEAAIESYQSALKQNPGDASAKHNLELAQKMLEQKKQQEEKKQESSEKSEPQNDDDKKQSSDKADQKQESQKESESHPQSGQAASPKDDRKQAQHAQGDQDQKSSGAQQQGQQSQGQQPAQGEAQQQSGANAQQQRNGNSAGQANQPNQSEGMQQHGTGNNQQAEQRQGSSAQAPSQVEQDKENMNPASPSQNGGQAADDKAVEGGNPTSISSHARTERDIKADQWLDHIQSDPGSFLKNQFMLEEQENADKQRGPS